MKKIFIAALILFSIFFLFQNIISIYAATQSAADCTPNQHFVANTGRGATGGQCVDNSTNTNTCPTGQHPGPRGGCVPDTTSPPTTSISNQNSCPPGQHPGGSGHGGGCVPDEGLQTEGQSCDSSGAPSLTCKNGFTCNGAGTCEKSPTNLPPAPLPPCATPGQNPCKSFNTGLGSIDTNAGGFVGKIFGVLLAASGGIALLLIIRAGYQIMTSRGNPEAIKEGRDRLISAIVGLLFLIFSLVLLELIGVDILRIPGFGGTQPVNGINHCNNACEPANSCSVRGGKSLGTLDCSAGTICCE